MQIAATLNVMVPVTDNESKGFSLKQTVLDKPENGSVCTNRNMIEIGG